VLAAFDGATSAASDPIPTQRVVALPLLGERAGVRAVLLLYPLLKD
jgi:hypothetical protein